MSSMRLLRVLRLTFLISLVGVHALAAWAATPAWQLIGDTLLFSQIALVVVWAVLGGGTWWVRLPLALLAGVGVVVVYRPVWSSTGNVAAEIVGVECGVMLLALFAARLAGYSLVDESLDTARPSWQFSIRSLMITTAIVAAALGTLQFVRQRFDFEFIVPSMLALGSIGVVFGLIALSGVWLLMGGGQLVLRMLIFGVVAVSLSVFPAYLCSRDADVTTIASWGAAHAVIVGFTLICVRLCGYRFVRRRGPLSAAHGHTNIQPHKDNHAPIPVLAR